MIHKRIEVFAMRYAGLPCPPPEFEKTDFYALKNARYYAFIEGYKQALSDVRIEVEMQLHALDNKAIVEQLPDTTRTLMKLDKKDLLTFFDSLENKEFNPNE